jgi:phosphate-selective porin
VPKLSPLLVVLTFPAAFAAGVETAATPVPSASATAPASGVTQAVEEPSLFHFNAGYNQDNFFLRSEDGNFVLIPSGRLQMDFLGYESSGSGKEPYDTFFLRRARLEAFGTFMKHFDFQLGAEFSNTTAPIATDDYVNINYTPYAQLQIGQFDAPFTMENRTSDKYTDLQERSVVIRGFAYPENKALGAMVWGQPEGKWAYWSGGIFNGEGQNVYVHHSNDFDFMGRVWFSPTGMMDVKPFEHVWVGASLMAGYRGWSAANQLDHQTFSDEAKVTFFSPIYSTPGGTATNNVHMGDYGNQLKYGLEANAPLGQLVLKAEWVHIEEDTRELDAANKLAVVRAGHISGDGMYLRVSYFAWGDPLINGLGGTQLPPHITGDERRFKTADALQLVLEWDRMVFYYTGDNGNATPAVDSLVGGYGFDVLSVGVNYWFTKRVRLTANFLYNLYSGITPTPLGGSTSYEFTGRVALAL